MIKKSSITSIENQLIHTIVQHPNQELTLGEFREFYLKHKTNIIDVFDVVLDKSRFDCNGQTIKLSDELSDIYPIKQFNYRNINEIIGDFDRYYGKIGLGTEGLNRFERWFESYKHLSMENGVSLFLFLEKMSCYLNRIEQYSLHTENNYITN